MILFQHSIIRCSDCTNHNIFFQDLKQKTKTMAEIKLQHNKQRKTANKWIKSRFQKTKNTRKLFKPNKSGKNTWHMIWLQWWYLWINKGMRHHTPFGCKYTIFKLNNYSSIEVKCTAIFTSQKRIKIYTSINNNLELTHSTLSSITRQNTHNIKSQLKNMHRPELSYMNSHYPQPNTKKHCSP